MKTFSLLAAVVMVTAAGCQRAEPPAPVEVKPPAATTPALPAGHPPLNADPTWAVPTGWQSIPATAMRRATFQVTGPGEQKAEVVVSAFPGDVGGLSANINRWRGQIGLEPVGDADVARLASPVAIGDKQTTVVDFASPTQRMVVVILPHAGSSWFFKLVGDPALVATEKDRLIEFVTSVKF